MRENQVAPEAFTRISQPGGSGSHAQPRRLSVIGAQPLSFAQERMWFLDQLEPDSVAYNSSQLIRLRGPLDIEAFQRSLAEVVRRHEVLRTRFPVAQGVPIQEVLPAGRFRVLVLDFSSGPKSEGEERARQWALEEFRRRFDLTEGLPLRATLLRLDEEDHFLALVAHHIVIDGWSMRILLREVATLYIGYQAGRPSSLPELQIQYRDYAAWQRERFEESGLQRERAYWRDRLSGVPAVLELPSDRPRGAAQSSDGGQLFFTLPGDLTDAVIALSRRERVTPFMTLLATFQVLLSRWSGQTDIVVGTPIAGRTRREFEDLIGCFTNTLALRTDCSGNPTFRELLTRVREATLSAFDHQDLPFEKLVEDLHLERSLGHHPLFQVLFNYRNYPADPVDASPLRIEDVELERGTAKFDLDLSLRREAGGLRGVLTYSLDLFEPESASHLVEQFQSLLQQVVRAPESSTHAFSLLTGRGRAALPDPSSAIPAATYPLVPELFAQVVKTAPARLAIRQGGHGWTYSELAAAADRIAHGLRAQGVARATVVAITGPSSFGLVAGMLAILDCGGVLLPIAADLPERRKRLMLQETGAAYLLHVGEASAADAWARDLTAITAMSIEAHSGRARARVTDPVDSASPGGGTPSTLTPEDSAYIFFTSGTTGIPKAVQGLHKGLSHFLAWQRSTFEIGPSDRCAQLTNISFDVVLRDVFLPLTSGATLCLPQEDLPSDRVLAWLASEEITVWHAVPSLVQVWLEHRLQGDSLRSLRWIFLAGEPLTDTLVSQLRRVVPKECEIVNLYGPTETTLAKCFYRVPAQIPPGVQPVGRPLPETQALVMNKSKELCGVNEPGEILIRTPFMTRGYINALEEQRRRFITNPFTGDMGDVLYRTGDLGRYRSDGTLLILARLDQQVKIRGVRVEPEEVSAVLARHPEVRACAVIARQEGDQAALVAFVVTGRDGVSASGLRAFLAERLPAAFIPSAFGFLDQLPLTPNGKLDRRALLAVDEQSGTPEQPYVAPRTPLESILAGIWTEVLGVAQVGVHDNFFELGGHSLLAAQVVARVRSALGVGLPLRALFETPTVAGVAPRIEAAHRLFEEVASLSPEEVRLKLSAHQAIPTDPEPMNGSSR
jgi:amino acid adenylation domain-containing protein